jgi:hypothetical protein
MSSDPAALYQELIKVMNMRPNEAIRRTWKCSAMVYSEPVDSEDSGWGKANGVLVLTNYRLTFLQNAGLLKKSYMHYYSTELSSITSVSVQKHGLLVEWMGKYRPEKNTFEKMEDLDTRSMDGMGGTDLQRSIADIMAAKSGAFAPPPPPQQQSMDFQAVARMGPGRVAGLRCPRCGGVMQFPTYGVEIWCPFCQVNIRADQVQAAPQLVLREG